MTASDALRRRITAAGRWSVSNGLVRTVTGVTGLQGRFHRLYWQGMYRAHGGTCTRAVNGAEVDLHSATPEGFRHCKTLMGERDVVEDVVAHVEPDDVFYDVGAYLGVYACFVCANHPSVRSVLFEPDPNKQEMLRRNVEDNDLSAAVHEYVLSETGGTVAFATSEASDGPNVSRIATAETDAAIEVTQTTGDDLVRRGAVPPPNVVKVDVEGAELDALRGMSETLGRDACRTVYCEVHPTLLPAYDASEADVHALLSELGFDVTRIGERGQEYFLRATK